MHPEITIVWADWAYAGKLVTWAKRRQNLKVKTVARPKDTSGFVLLPRRWVVERSLAWMMNARRHARDYERLIQHSETLITWAAITLMTRRLTRAGATWSKKPESPPRFRRTSRLVLTPLGKPPVLPLQIPLDLRRRQPRRFSQQLELEPAGMLVKSPSDLVDPQRRPSVTI